MLAREEPFAGEEVTKAFEAEGITVHTNTRVTAVQRHDDGTVTATLDHGDPVTADELLVAVGRRPSTTDLGLETVGLTPGKPIDVDNRLVATGIEQTGGDWLYAIGDCNGLALLTHMGKYQGRIAGDVIAGKKITDRSSRDIVPRVTFTDPQVCAVGLTETQARERGLDVRVLTYPTGDVPGAYTRAKYHRHQSTGGGRRPRGDRRRHVHRAGPVRTVAQCHDCDCRRGTDGRSGPRRAVVPDHERGLAAPAGVLRPLTRLDRRTAKTPP